VRRTSFLRWSDNLLVDKDIYFEPLLAGKYHWKAEPLSAHRSCSRASLKILSVCSPFTAYILGYRSLRRLGLYRSNFCFDSMPAQGQGSRRRQYQSFPSVQDSHITQERIRYRLLTSILHTFLSGKNQAYVYKAGRTLDAKDKAQDTLRIASDLNKLPKSFKKWICNHLRWRESKRDSERSRQHKVDLWK
jgi:hypothetical protein